MAVDVGTGFLAIGAGLAVGLAGIGSGLGEKDVAAASVGAITEDMSLFGKCIVLIVLPETIVIFGMVIAFMILFTMV
jgi:V/A-type H+-transporting ATPase subunit K